ncbi:MAG: DUF4198 domain-containing protein [Pseudorhodoplanes sp.]|uniref:DUF4198 domain-containing protein n=1 Tax=Pseudorhodoplanes sp. TaxID=1934341 RepID=UPI003D0D6B4C
MKFSRTHFPRTWLAAALCLALPLSAQAHRSWMLPSATILSGGEVWVTVDAAVSNDLFYFEHFPLRIANIGAPPEKLGARGGRPGVLLISAPDGAKVEPQNGNIGRYRSTFDVPLKQKGTYKLAVVNDGVFASFKEGGKVKRWRGNAEDFAKEVPPEAEELRASYLQSRMEVFVTAGKPSTDTLKTSGKGLELSPITHPNDLVAGSDASFRMLLDGKPAANLKVTVIPGGNRYRDKLGEMNLTTDADGKFSVTWPGPGMYWMEAVVRDEKSPVKEVKQRRAGYIATLEVLPQ